MNEIRNSKEGEPQTTSSSSSSTEVPQGVRWCPSQFNFSPYSPVADTDVKLRQSLRVVVRRPLVGRLTKDIVETYKLCNPHFHYSDELNPKRYLTSPSVGVLNDGHDNTNSDLILAVNYVLSNSGTQQRYIVKDILGHGTFGQVAKCWVPEIKSFLAVKVIKNQPAYHQQALVEVSILTTLNRKYDPEDKHHIVRIYDYFVFQRHLCIVFELLESNLYELVKLNQFRGLSLNVVQLFSKQILRGLSLMKDAGIIHCDLKPENILLCSSKPAQIKIIDFGSACTENRTVYSYIQSRYYRSPEVLLGYQYSTAIDMWSLGCIVAELFLGLPLFPGASEYDLLKRMIKILGGHPPDYVLKDAKNTNKFFKFVGNASHNEGSEHSNRSQSVYQALSEEEYEARELKKPSIGKEYFNHMNLEEIVSMYPYRRGLREEEIAKENEIRLALIDFLRGLVEFDPTKRWSPLQALKHPFVTGEPFTQPYKPLPETPRVPVSRNVNVDHHPAGGHWFAAGLSPNISGRARLPMHNSPHFQVVSHGYSGSYGSLGSHGSYNENYGLGSSSYGSYGDNSNMHAYFSPVGPSVLKSGIPILGSSPDARLRIPQLPHGHGLGVSPSAGNFVPMSLGSSPSQFTPPCSYGHISAGSPGQYGPTSPAKGSSGHGSPLGKGAASSHFNRRKNMGYSTSLHSQENSSISHWQGQIAEASSYSQFEATSLGFGGMPLHLQSSANAPSWKQQQSGCGITPGHYVPHNVRGSFALGPNMQFSHLKGTAYDKPEASLDLPNPGDWDPNYSEDLLLQEDGSELGCLASDFNKSLHFNPGLPPLASSKHNYVSGMTSGMSMQRPNGSIQSFSHGEDGNPSSAHDMYGGTRHLPKTSHITSHISSNSPSRLGQQQPIHRFNQGRSTAIKVQPSPSGFNFGGPLSPGGGSSSSPFGSGRRGNHPVTNIPPTSRGRKDYSGFA
ncbi:dual specificity protein kinase YAK1 homolog isoform X2 [Impatiens glandulifera]|uniref:dual specificity protein kinase YAK1 homolog isoform X2 n=1 Tax=Impatiens glandulifera TaxID=253017 RepID=UPI001FB0CB8D|nr:dual specificity protein kinase YAK1 homolog isoform X2 [Impatiens glandulifera]